jgi:hypothetical protein
MEQAFSRPTPLPHTEMVNALRLHFRNWIMNDTLPPPSRCPRLADGTLVDATREVMGFPALPGLQNDAPTGLINPLIDYDWGPPSIARTVAAYGHGSLAALGAWST